MLVVVNASAIISLPPPPPHSATGNFGREPYSQLQRGRRRGWQVWQPGLLLQDERGLLPLLGWGKGRSWKNGWVKLCVCFVLFFQYGTLTLYYQEQFVMFAPGFQTISFIDDCRTSSFLHLKSDPPPPDPFEITFLPQFRSLVSAALPKLVE